MKIKTITVRNFKALSDQELNLNGASAIITAGNNEGKTSILRGLVDRFRGEKPEIIVKQGEEKGENVMELTDGSKIGWKFTHKTENFSFTTPEGIKMTTGVLKSIGEIYFGIKFSIDKFISSSRKEQLKQVQILLGIDLSALDQKHKEKFDARTEANRVVKTLLGLNTKKPEVVENPDIEAIKKRKTAITENNTKLKEKWVIDNEAHQKEAIEFNQLQQHYRANIKTLSEQKLDLEKYKGQIVATFIDYKKLEKYINDIPEPLIDKEVTSLVEPVYGLFTGIDKEIEDAYTDKAKFDTYNTDLTNYNDWVEKGGKARKKADELSAELDKINEEKLKLIKGANLPEEFKMTDNGLLYKGLPLDDNQISSSAKYICALKLGALSLGKVNAMHFDASFLDKKSLMEIQEWANSQDLQLLLEKVDYEGGSIKYNFIEE
jgi:hypothetical protein